MRGNWLSFDDFVSDVRATEKRLWWRASGRDAEDERAPTGRRSCRLPLLPLRPEVFARVERRRQGPERIPRPRVGVAASQSRKTNVSTFFSSIIFIFFGAKIESEDYGGVSALRRRRVVNQNRIGVNQQPPPRRVLSVSPCLSTPPSTLSESNQAKLELQRLRAN